MMGSSDDKNGTNLLELSLKDLILLYVDLKKNANPDPFRRERLCSRIEKMLFEQLTIEEMEHIEEFYRKL